MIEAEILDEELPSGGEMIKVGRASLAEHGLYRDPDAAGEQELDQDLEEARPKKTVRAENYQWGRFILWTGATGREHLPPHEVTLRVYIKAHLTLRRDPDDPKKFKPYAYKTVEQAIYLIGSILERLGYPGRITKKVSAQLAWYEWKLRQMKIPKVPHRSVAITPAESVRIARQANRKIISGLRAATAFRLLFDSGMRVGELLAMTWDDVRWVDERRVIIHIPYSKTHEARDVRLQAPPDDAADLDVDPFWLFRTWFQLCRDRDHLEPHMRVFPTVHPARERRDGLVSGNLTDAPWEYQDLHREWTRFVTGAGVNVDQFTGRPRVATTHGNRAGHVTGAGLAGVRPEVVARGTGHSLTSSSFWDYFRSELQWGDGNPGYVIRAQQAGQRAAETDPTGPGATE